MASVKDFGSEAEEPIEPADGFSDVEDLKQHGICLPPTREDVHQLQKVYDGKYADELYFVEANYNAMKDEKKRKKKKTAVKYKKVENYLLEKFRLYKLKSTKGRPFSTSRGHYLGRIRGDKEAQTKRADKIRKQIKSN